jgi:hypothetical protein
MAVRRRHRIVVTGDQSMAVYLGPDENGRPTYFLVELVQSDPNPETLHLDDELPAGRSHSAHPNPAESGRM